MTAVTNISAYQFAPLADLPGLRKRLLDKCNVWGLKGTILISPEGINVFVAGGGDEIESLLNEIRSLPGLAGFCPKVSISDEQPFNRMLVRIKREIIAFGIPGIDPAQQTAPKLSPRELKQWLDERRPVTLLDTRNDYEVKLGTFENAVSLGINHFRCFPEAVDRLPVGLKQEPIVMFCTGGIRCEKAGAYMQREGFEHVFQLDGGILKYFEECGSEHYSGECFVFDRRVGVDSDLAPTENTQCFNCLSPLSVADQQDPRYIYEKSCPHCFVTEAARMESTIADRVRAIAKATNPLPGSAPYDNYRPVTISAQHDGITLFHALCKIFPQLPPEHWRERFAQQLLLDRDRTPVNAERRVRFGEQYLHRFPETSEPDVNVAIGILYEDEAIVVINKPAPLPIHASGRFNRNTLQSILNTVYQPQKLRPVHRLDANTTGVVVFARTRQYSRLLHPQFAASRVSKRYLARIQGQPPERDFACDAPIGAETIQLGARAIEEHGLDARTDFRMLHQFADGTSLVEARPITGRTNQIRIHLWHLGWPICGDQTYLPNQQLGDAQTHQVADPPLCLHSLSIAFNHPLTGDAVSFECDPPAWADQSPGNSEIDPWSIEARRFLRCC
jgi:RluA family pseudouridine synthase